MAQSVSISCLVLLLVSAGCSDAGRGDSDRSGSLAAALIKSASQDSASTPEKALVLRARALDRADSLDAAKALYLDAAKKIPAIADWLNLRAAGVTRERRGRAA